MGDASVESYLREGHKLVANVVAASNIPFYRSIVRRTIGRLVTCHPVYTLGRPLSRYVLFCLFSF